MFVDEHVGIVGIIGSMSTRNVTTEEFVHAQDITFHIDQDQSVVNFTQCMVTGGQ